MCLCIKRIRILIFVVQPIMFCRRHYNKVLYPIIADVLVNVMNIFMAPKSSAKMLFHSPTVLRNAASVFSQLYITFSCAFSHAVL